MKRYYFRKDRIDVVAGCVIKRRKWEKKYNTKLRLQ